MRKETDSKDGTLVASESIRPKKTDDDDPELIFDMELD